LIFFHSTLLTVAIASLQAGFCFLYQAVASAYNITLRCRPSASSVTIEKSPSNTGVVRAMAFSDYCLCIYRSQVSPCLLQRYHHLDLRWGRLVLKMFKGRAIL
jgi:hypothetical protein